MCTGNDRDNARLGEVAHQAGATVYYEQEFPEWDLVSRHIMMAYDLKISEWISYSGDCPFTDLRILPLIWKRLIQGDVDHVGVTTTYSAVSDRMASGQTLELWEKWDGFYDLDDQRREQPWVHHQDYTSANVEPPWPLSRTLIKTSIDFPFEGAIADLIVRTLGHYPQDDDELQGVYKTIHKIKSVEDGEDS